MHSRTKITPYTRKEIYGKYSEKMQETKGKQKEKTYEELGKFYRVHKNTIRKIIDRGKRGDFTIHKSTTKQNLGHQFKTYTK